MRGDGAAVRGAVGLHPVCLCAVCRGPVVQGALGGAAVVPTARQSLGALRR